MTKKQFKEKVKVVAMTVWNATKEGFTKAVKGLSSLAGEALSACEAKKAAADIQAQAALRNFMQQAIREYPRVYLNSAQEMALIPPEYHNQGAYLLLDKEQSENIMTHMIQQFVLEPESRKQLISLVSNLAGVPNVLSPVYATHKLIGEKIVLKFFNDIRKEAALSTKEYQNITDKRMYWGNNLKVHLLYNVRLSDYATEIKKRFNSSGQYIEEIRQELISKGIQINEVTSQGVYLDITIEWTQGA